MGIFAFVDRYGYKVDTILMRNLKMFLPKNKFFEPCQKRHGSLFKKTALHFQIKLSFCHSFPTLSLTKHPVRKQRGVAPKPPPGTVARARGDLRLLTDMDIKLT